MDRASYMNSSGEVDITTTAAATYIITTSVAATTATTTKKIKTNKLS